MQIDYNEMKAFFDRLEIEEGIEFEYMDRPFTVWFGEYTELERRENKSAIFYSASDINDGWDIYVPRLKERFMRPVLVHECIEALVNREFAEQNRGKGSMTIEEDRTNHLRAHEFARSYDERYARDTLSSRQLREYLGIKEKYKEFR